jgi:hypothetical protein
MRAEAKAAAAVSAEEADALRRSISQQEDELDALKARNHVPPDFHNSRLCSSISK